MSNLVADFDQVETTLENFSQLVATYYKSLVEKGISKKFAKKLVMDYHHTFWANLNKSDSK